jgi:hypothetical protein
MKRALKFTSGHRLPNIGCGTVFGTRAVPEGQMAICVHFDRIRSSPEEWVKLDEERKNQLREIILELRKLDDTRSAGAPTIQRP